MPDYPRTGRSVSPSIAPLGRPQLQEVERLGMKLTISLSPQQHGQLQTEQRQAGYRSLAAFVRECKLGFRGLD